MLDFDLTNNGLIQESPVRQLAAQLLADSSYSGVKYYEKEDEYTEKIFAFLKECDRTIIILRNYYDAEDIDMVAVKSDQVNEANDIILRATKEWNCKEGIADEAGVETVFDYVYEQLRKEGVVFNIVPQRHVYTLDNEQYIISEDQDVE